MSPNLKKIIEFSETLGLEIVQKDEKEELIIVSNEEKGILNMIIDCEETVLIFEQMIYMIKNTSHHHYLRLLQMNRGLIHGAFVVDEEGKRVIFKDSLQLANLDFNEFEGTINALSLGLAEYSNELLSLNEQ